jgi:hypothetical protein
MCQFIDRILLYADPFHQMTSLIMAFLLPHHLPRAQMCHYLSVWGGFVQIQKIWHQAKGSLFQIRNKFHHRNVNDCINSCVYLWNFETEGYACLLACKILRISSLMEYPEDIVVKDLNSYIFHKYTQLLIQSLTFRWWNLFRIWNKLPFSAADLVQ